MAERITVVSADGHAGCSPEHYGPYIDPAYRDRIGELEREEQVMRTAMGFVRGGLAQPGVYEVGEECIDLYSDVKRRLAEQDAQGIAAELLISGTDHAGPFCFAANRAYPEDVRAAGLRAYHRWLADLASEADDRLMPNGYPGDIVDLNDAVTELNWVADHGFVSVEAPGHVSNPNRPPLHGREYDRFWAACVERGLVVNIHAGWGAPQGPLFDTFEKTMGMLELTADLDLEAMSANMMEQDSALLDADTEGSPFALDMGPRQALWQLMLGGVFDRFPSLKVILTEVRSDWVPATLAYLDQRFAKQARHLELKPSEYYRRNCAVTPSAPHRAEIAMREEIGIDQFMFGADMPHPESTWPNTQQWLGHAFARVPEEEVRKILGGNAIRFFNLDGAHLDDIAARIGPTLAELTASGADVTQARLEHFNQRAGYLKPAQEVSYEKIDQRLDSDFAQFSAT